MYIPLDERPCNYRYPAMIYSISGNQLFLPPLYLLGYKKRAADVSGLRTWILDNLHGVEYLVLSIDMLVFGGILPSRIHHLSEEEMMSRLDFLKIIKDKYPYIKIFAFNLITRVPEYNSSDEEPDYYEDYGEQIYKLGYLSDKMELNLLNIDGQKELAAVEKSIPEAIRNDYLCRREKNHQLNQKAVQLVGEEVIDFLIFPMDDNSEYGFSTRERRKLMELVAENKLFDKIYSYPGADEVGSVLTIRAFFEQRNYHPTIFTRYSSEKGKNLIPSLEDRSLEQTVKYQIITAGGILVDNNLEADFVLMVNTPTETTLGKEGAWDSIFNKGIVIDSHRNLHEFVTVIKYYLSRNIKIAVADVAVLNGSDGQLMHLMKMNDLLPGLISYGGWNTSSNTLGTVIAHASMLTYFQTEGNVYSAEQRENSYKFLFLRYLEDWGYQYYIRAELTKKLADYGLDYFDLKDKGDMVAELVYMKLNDFAEEYLKDFNYDFKVTMPWNRMFETEIIIK